MGVSRLGLFLALAFKTPTLTPTHTHTEKARWSPQTQMQTRMPTDCVHKQTPPLVSHMSKRTRDIMHCRLHHQGSSGGRARHWVAGVELM